MNHFFNCVILKKPLVSESEESMEGTNINGYGLILNLYTVLSWVFPLYNKKCEDIRLRPRKEEKRNPIKKVFPGT